MEYLDITNLDKEPRCKQRVIEQYLFEKKKELNEMNEKELKEWLLSEFNFNERSQLKSCLKYCPKIKAGDVCYIDYGKAYLQEVAYQHMGLVISVFDAKAFVIPMTSNFETYKQAYDELYNPYGLKHLMVIGKKYGLQRYSVLFLNDGKFINTARIIDIKGHMETDGNEFKKVCKRLLECLQV